MLGRRTGGPADGWTAVTLSEAKGRLLDFIRNIAGMPNYERHIEHLRRCHPGIPIPTERSYYEEFVRARYGDGPTRCC